MKKLEDLHKKATHMSVPIKSGIEFHFQDKDLPNRKALKVGDKVAAHIPMLVTSKDIGHTRFKQVNKVTVEKGVKDVVKKIMPSLKTKRRK